MLLYLGSPLKWMEVGMEHTAASVIKQYNVQTDTYALIYYQYVPLLTVSNGV